MPKGLKIKEEELMVIRVCHSAGIRPVDIARGLGRSRESVHQKLAQMRRDSTLDDMPVEFVSEALLTWMHVKVAEAKCK